MQVSTHLKLTEELLASQKDLINLREDWSANYIRHSFDGKIVEMMEVCLCINDALMRRIRTKRDTIKNGIERERLNCSLRILKDLQNAMDDKLKRSLKGDKR